MTSPVVHWEIGALDAGKLGSFYREMFDWQITPAGPEYSLVAGAGGGIGGGILQVSEHVPPYLTFYVQVEELESALHRAVELGADELVRPTMVPGVGRFAMFADPEGHVIGLMEPVSDDGSVPPAGEPARPLTTPLSDDPA